MSGVEQRVSEIFEQAAAGEASDREKRGGEPAEIVFGPKVNAADKFEILQLLQVECDVDVLRRRDAEGTAVYTVEPRVGGEQA